MAGLNHKIRTEYGMFMRTILLSHYKDYPASEVVDLIKLLYQSEFAGSHMISDETASLRRLQAEIEQLRPADWAGQPLFREIGNGLCRLNLGPAAEAGLSAETINHLFIRASNQKQGSRPAFEEKLRLLQACCTEGLLPYPAAFVHEEMRRLREQGYPPVRHSNAYRAAYHPAYRIIQQEYLTFFSVFCGIDQLLNSTNDSQRPVTVAIDGMSGSGKSYLAALLTEIYDCNLFHMDDYFLRPEQRTPQRLAEIGGNIDYERFSSEISSRLKTGRPFTYRKYDCGNWLLSKPIAVQPKRLNIIEGVYSLHPAVHACADLKILIRTTEHTQIQRIRKRSGTHLLKRFQQAWIPAETAYFTAFHIEECCDIRIIT